MITLMHRLVAASLILCSAYAFAQSGGEKPIDLAREHTREVAALYGRASWPAGATRDGIALASLALEGWRGGPLSADRGELSRPFFRTKSDARDPSFVVEARVADTAAAAQDALVDWLAGVSSPRRMPDVREWSLAVGETGFLGPSGAGPRSIAWIAFVRGNVAVRVAAFDARVDPELDLGGIASAIDAAIVDRTPLPAGAAPARPQITKLTPSATSVAAGAKVALETAWLDSARGEPQLQWIVGGPGQGYVEASSSGAFELHTTGAGHITLTLEVTGSTGTFARRSVEIDVAGD